MNRTIALIKKDILLETRQQYTLYGILLYVASTIFVVYMTMGQPEEKVWNGLFWVIQLFVCINAVAKSFLQETKGRMLYFFTVCSATEFIVSKLVYNLVLMLILCSLQLMVYTLLLGNPLVHFWAYWGIALLGSGSISIVFSFLAAIASKAQQSGALMAIMGFPLIIPQILLLMKIANGAFSDVLVLGWWQMVFLLMGFDVMVVALSLVLFPYLWKD